ncbi:MAG: hypothetical protein HZB57_07430 [Gammaproteobacteria bacterium]|nr:hypothetical protein [Gammaproteobacteria bacterium]
MSVSRGACILLMYALCVAAPVFAASDSAVFPPLSSEELDAVVGEIRAMVKTDESQVSDFVVREATPARIDRLYHMPELPQLEQTVRENGLIFAGQGSILTFDKPSDIVGKVSAWFPGEIAAARASDRQSFFGYVHMWGPYTSWGDEQIAFLTLWNCMPQIAWLRPAENPFTRRLSDSLPFMAIAARSSNELDFGQCVRTRSGLRPAWTEADIPVVRKEVRDMSERVTPVLRNKFANFLTTHRCQGTGPDDCVLILLLWASLSPADAELAVAIQMLEAEVAPDSPLPELQKPADQYEDGAQEGEQRFDTALRQAAFLRAKLISVLNAPTAWPADALQALLHQLTQLQQKLAAAIDHRWNYYELDYYNEPVNPWSVFARCPGNTPQVQAAILAELNGIGADATCAVYEQWFKQGGASLQTAYALKRLTANQSLRCASPDWAWLKQGRSSGARALRNGYLALLGRGETGSMHDMLLSGLTDNGQACFDGNAVADTGWLHDVCKTWISEPQAVRPALEHSRLRLGDAEAFSEAPLEPIPAAVMAQDERAQSEQAQWLGRLGQNRKGDAGQKLQAIAAELSRRGVLVYAATQWNHPDHPTSLIELQISMAEQSSEPVWPFMGSRLLLVIEPQNIALVGVPQRFNYQYDEGEIAHVSDLDEDGKFEVWFSGTFGECDGEDLQPGVDCAIETLHMGEITGDALSYFANTPKQWPMLKRVGASGGLEWLCHELATFG